MLTPHGLDRAGIEAIKTCAGILRAGGLVAFPTETVYGLGALATLPAAVRSIFAAKGRPQDNPLIVHIASVRQLDDLAIVPSEAYALARAFWPGPLTVVVKSRELVAPEVSAGLDTVGIRMPDNPIALELIRHAGPVAAPSANVSGRPSPTTAGHVLADLDGKIDAVLDGGPTGVGLESTVLDLSHTAPAILRPGGVTYEMLKRILPAVMQAAHSALAVDKPRSPGQKYAHYAPRAEVIVVKGTGAEDVLQKVSEQARLLLGAGYRPEGPTGTGTTATGIRPSPGPAPRLGILSTTENIAAYRDRFRAEVESGRLVILDAGPRSDPSVIASRLFAALREFDALGVDSVLAESVPETDIGAAIMDRLSRAASQVIEAPDRPFTVLFVCSGNTCRSPLAQAIFSRKAREAGLHIRFLSAGTSAVEGDRASVHARTVAKEKGLDLDSHVAATVSLQHVVQADVILTMRDEQKAEMLARFPEVEGKVSVIGEYLDDPGHEVPDPFGKSLDEYRKTAATIEYFAHLFFEKHRAGREATP